MPDRTESPHPDVTALRAQISEWRSARSPRCRLSDGIWAAAVRLARKLGAYRTAREIGVSYDALRSHLDAPRARPRHARRSAVEFVDAGPASLLSPPADAVLEIHVENGRVTMRIPVSQKLDMTLVAAALWSVR